MDEREFLSTMYQEWAKTTGDDHSYWVNEPMANNPGRHKIYAVTVDPDTGSETREVVASFLSEQDAAWIVAVRGSFGDVYRRVLEAFDEADGLDLELDRQIESVAHLCVHIDELRDQVTRLERDLERSDLDYLGAKGEAEYWKEQAQSER